MDIQTSLVYVGVVVISAAVVVLVSMFGIKEKSYEEAIAEQRKLPDDLLLGKKEKGKEKKHKNKGGKKVKEKKEERQEEKPEHVQFEETPQILPPEVPQDIVKGSKKKNKSEKVKSILVNKDEPVALVTELNSPDLTVTETNHFEIIHPKDDLELIRSHSKENLHQITQSELAVNKLPKDTPTKSKKSPKESAKRKEDAKEDKSGDVQASTNSPQTQQRDSPKEVKESLPKEIKETVKEVSVIPLQSVNKESKKIKKKNDILAQIGGDRDGVNVSLLMALVQKAELSRSETQILIEQLLNKQTDNPLEHSEWTEGRADPVLKLKKQLAEKEKSFADEKEASIAFQNKLKELRSELNSERSRFTANIKQLEEALNVKITETQTLHTRMQHILESHAAEKQGFARQIETLQGKVNDNAVIIHKMQEDQGQTQGHMQQELIAQRKQLDMQFQQMREAENHLKGQLAQKCAELQELQNHNVGMSQDLQATIESSSHEIDMLRQQVELMQNHLTHLEGEKEHFKEASQRLQEMVPQLEESHRAHADLDHRLKNAHRHEQELQKQINSLQVEVNATKAEAAESKLLKNRLLKSEEELKKCQSELSRAQDDLSKSRGESKELEKELNEARAEIKKLNAELSKAINDLKEAQAEVAKLVEESKLRQGEFRNIKADVDKDSQLKIMRLQEENDRLCAQLGNHAELQKELKQLQDENESLASQLAATTERPAAEGRENGIEEKSNKYNIETQANLLVKETQLKSLRVEVSEKDSEISKLNALVSNLRSDINYQQNVFKRLQADLDQQRSKNNELRTKNWKVMEALSAAESRAKSNVKKSNDEITFKEEHDQEATKALLQRIFPDIKVAEASHDLWLTQFENKVKAYVAELNKKEASSPSADVDLVNENKNLQSMVTHYKQIIVDTEGMLNILQSNIETEEEGWIENLRQKETEVKKLRVELGELRNKYKSLDSLKDQSSLLEERLNESECQQDEMQSQSLNSSISSEKVQRLPEVERLQENEVCEGSSSDQSTSNGPSVSESLSEESTKKSAAKGRRIAGWFRKKVTTKTSKELR